MANWTIDYTGAVLTGTVGTAVTAGETISAVIKPIDENGDISGYYIEAKNFMIGNATQGTGSPTLLNTWTGGNVDTEVNSIVFADLGTPGDIDNTVSMVVTLNGFTPAAEVDTLTFDVDENPAHPISIFVESKSAILASWPFVNTAQHAVAIDTTYSTYTTITLGDAATPALHSVVATPQDEAFSKIFSATFTSGASYHYTDNPTASLTNLGTYIDNYVVKIDKTISGGLTTAFTVNVLYSPPKSGSNYPDPVNFSSLGHRLNLSYNVVPNEVSVTNTITSVTVNKRVSYLGGEQLIQVYGTAGARYTIYAQNKTSNEYYDFNGSYQTTSIGEIGVVDSKGSSWHILNIPSSTVDVSYDILVVGLDDVTLSSIVPTVSGDLVIVQYGLKTASINLHSHTLANFSTLPSAITFARGGRYKGDYFTTTSAITTTGYASTRGSSTFVNLTKYNPVIKPGMLAIGNLIPYNTTVLDVNENYIVLSQASTLNSTTIKFIENTADIVPFSFSVAPNNNTLSVNTSNDHIRSVWGFDDVTGVVSGTQNGSNKTLVLDSTNGILVGMQATGAGITAGSLVNTITDATTLQLDTTYSSVTDNAEIEFSGANNPEMSVVSMVVTKVGTNIVISGYIKAREVTTTADIKINIDDMITISAATP